MNFLKKWILLVSLFSLLGTIEAIAQPIEKEKSLWSDYSEVEMIASPFERQIIPQIYRTVALEVEAFKSIMEQAPMRFTDLANSEKVYLELPMPDGSMETFDVVKASILHPDLAARFPQIQSFAGQGVEDPTAYVRFDITPKGFHAMILSSQHSTVFIDPYANGDTEHYISYFKKDYGKQNADPFYCGVESSEIIGETFEGKGEDSAKTLLAGDCILRKYRLALACTGEYASFHGGSVPTVLAAMNTSMTRVIGVYERELTITMELIPNTDELIYLNGATDPYTNNNGGQMLGENQSTVDEVIGTDNYDIGHVFSTGGGGIASLNSPCNPSQKARGVTGLGSPVGDVFDIDYVCHEMGHQFGGNHTQNNSCNINLSTAMEPGSASTIMGYAGICDPNVQNNSDDYFHIVSIREIAQNITTGTSSSCYEEVVSTNNAPTADAGLDYTIPIDTPFELTGTADDIDDASAITSTWEQMDNTMAPMPPSGQSTVGPLFRSVDLTAPPSRTFPRLPALVNNQSPTWEVLPEVERTMNFTFSVRDNNPLHGCTADDDMLVTVSEVGGPFRVTNPDTSGISYEVNEVTEVKWDVANTDLSPVNCAFVNITLSVDGGYTYPYLLAYQQPNSGIAEVTIPNVLTSQARVRVQAFENVFFDISNKNFSIIPSTVPGFTLNVGPSVQEACLPAVIDISFETDSILGFNNEVHFALVGGLPDDVAVYEQNPIIPGQSGSISLNLDNGIPSGVYEVVLQAAAEGIDTVFRSFILDLTRNDFSHLAMDFPPDGENGIILTTDFIWNPIEDADTYDFEISSSPIFGDSTFISAFGLTDTLFTPTEFFEESSLLYWRIRPENECGAGEWLEPFVFQTLTSTCDVYVPTGLPINISGSGTPTIQSLLNIGSTGVISDVNIPFMKAVFQPVNSLRISLISPAGTEVILFDQNCANTQNLRIGFDDNSPFEIECPPDDGIVFRPIEELSNFAGEDIQGEWIVKVKVVESGFGASGALEEWSIEFCASSSTESPFVVTNDTLYVPPSDFNYITETELEIEDNDSDNLYVLEYTIVTPPTEGTLYYIDEPLSAGDVFRQTGINAYNVTYVHNGGDEIYDHFTFIARDGEGGLIPSQRFNIKIDENATVGTEAVLQDVQVNVYPNPAKTTLYVNIDDSIQGDIQLGLFNVQGQLLLQTEKSAGNQFDLDVQAVPSGMYFLTIRTEQGSLTKKIVVER
jgi:subtilisin-like proprotein convertase family protein